MDRKQLERIHRVRTLQLGIAQAAEADAADGLASETALATRIADLAQAVAPVPSHAPGVSLAAAAHYRDKLHQSAQTAATRVHAATTQAEATRTAREAAHRDRTAIEKLIARAGSADVAKAIRAMEDAPLGRPRSFRVRHEPC